MKLLKFNNSAIMLLVSERAIMKAAVVAGSNKAITVDDNANLVNGDFLVFGEPIMAKSEIAKINAAVTPGTAIQVDSLTFPHAIGTPIYKIPYDQVKFYHADTLTGDKTLIGSAVDIDVEDEYTVVVDSTNSTGYLFFQAPVFTSSELPASVIVPAIVYFFSFIS